MHHGTCVTHVPWSMLGFHTCGGGENVPSIPGAWATPNFVYLVRGPWYSLSFTAPQRLIQVYMWAIYICVCVKESESVCVCVCAFLFVWLSVLCEARCKRTTSYRNRIKDMHEYNYHYLNSGSKICLDKITSCLLIADQIVTICVSSNFHKYTSIVLRDEWFELPMSCQCGEMM